MPGCRGARPREDLTKPERTLPDTPLAEFAGNAIRKWKAPSFTILHGAFGVAPDALAFV